MLKKAPQSRGFFMSDELARFKAGLVSCCSNHVASYMFPWRCSRIQNAM